MSSSPLQPADLRWALGEALIAEGLAGECSAEELALLASRQAQALPPAQRQALLRRIAADPAAAELLADLQHAGFAFDKPWSLGCRVVFFLWLVSLVLLVVFGVWKLIDITAVAPETYPGSSAFNLYMDIAARQQSRGLGPFREFGLAISVGLSFALVIPVLWWATRRRRAGR